MALIRVRDDLVRERAILLAENALNATTPSGGKKKERLTEREIKKLIGQAEQEVRKTLTTEYLEDKNTSPSDVPKPDKSSIETEPGPEPVHSSPLAMDVDTVMAPDLPQEQPTPTPKQPAEQITCSSTPRFTPISYYTEICKTGKCPDGKDHLGLIMGKGRMECDLIEVEISHLPHNECPLLLRQRETEAEGVRIAVETPDPSVTNRPDKIQWTPTKMQSEYIDQMVASGDYSNAAEVVSEGIHRMMESIPVAVTAELEIQNPGI